MSMGWKGNMGVIMRVTRDAPLMGEALMYHHACYLTIM